MVPARTLACSFDSIHRLVAACHAFAPVGDAVKQANWHPLQTANVVWKKNRNAFARLLLDQLRAGRLAEPFHQMPPDGPLPTLPKHAAYAFAQPRSPPRQEHRWLPRLYALY